MVVVSGVGFASGWCGPGDAELFASQGIWRHHHHQPPRLILYTHTHTHTHPSHRKSGVPPELVSSSTLIAYVPEGQPCQDTDLPTDVEERKWLRSRFNGIQGRRDGRQGVALRLPTLSTLQHH